MRDALKRLERLEESGVSSFKWEAVCERCATEGRATTPYEHCEVGRCNSSVIAELAADQVERMREAFRKSCIWRGQDPDEEEAKITREMEAERLAWDAKKRDMREAANA